MNIYKVMRRLYDAGLVCVGEGSFGVAVKSNGKYIYKIGSLHEEGSPDAWFFYAKWLIDNKITNPHFPRIFNLIGDEQKYIASMELLTIPFSDELQHNAIMFEMETILDLGLREDSIQDLQKWGFKEVNTSDFVEAIEIATAAMEWAQENVSDEIQWDIHSGNFMRREKDSPLVFLDPWWFSDY